MGRATRGVAGGTGDWESDGDERMAIVERMDHETGRSRKYKVKATPRVAARRIAGRARRVTDDRVTVAKVEDGLEVRGKYPPGQYDGTDGKYVIAIVRA